MGHKGRLDVKTIAVKQANELVAKLNDALDGDDEIISVCPRPETPGVLIFDVVIARRAAPKVLHHLDEVTTVITGAEGNVIAMTPIDDFKIT